MTAYDAIVIGTGTAGGYLADRLGRSGMKGGANRTQVAWRDIPEIVRSATSAAPIKPYYLFGLDLSFLGLRSAATR
jgi:hypothetical protein